MECVLAIFNGCTLILVAIIQTTNIKTKKKEEIRYKRRLQHEILSIDLMQCNTCMSVLSAKKQAGEHINGDLEIAIDTTEKAYNNYRDFVQREYANAVAQS